MPAGTELGELGAVAGALQGFLQPSGYVPRLKPLSSGPPQSLYFLSSESFFPLSFSLPALSRPAFFSYVIPVPLARTRPMHFSQLFWCPPLFPLVPSPSLSLSFSLLSDHLHAPSLALLAISFPPGHFPSFCIPACLTQFFLLFLHFLFISSKLLKF